ncbi:MAG: hypothetical protein V2B20_19795 [Pseudomonadota bacterium]
MSKTPNLLGWIGNKKKMCRKNGKKHVTVVSKIEMYPSPRETEKRPLLEWNQYDNIL